MPVKGSDTDDEGPAKPAEAAAPRAKRRRSQPLKVANQIPQSRREEIEKALEDTSSTPKKWSRKDGPKYHRFLRKRISPGTVRQIEFDLLDVDIGESWPIPITVIHGARPGPVVTVLGALPVSYTHLTLPTKA